jgi:HEAT repeat protein
MRSLFSIIASIVVFTGTLFAQVDHIASGQESIDLLKVGTPIERQQAIFNLIGKKVQRSEWFLPAVKDPDPTVRYYAVLALSQFEEASQFPLIIEGMLEDLNDENLWVREQVIDTLTHITFKQRLQDLKPDERVLKAVLNYSKDPDPYIRAAATEGLVLWGKDPIAKQELLASVDDPVWLVRRHSSGLPKGYYGKTELQILSGALRDEDYRVRLDALYKLRNYAEEPKILDYIIERLTDPDGQVVIETIATLGLFKDPAAVKPLLKLLAKYQSLEPDIRAAIYQITGKSLAEALKAYKLEPDKDILGAAPIKEVDVNRQLELFKNGNQSERVSAVLRLTWSNHPQAIEALIQALKDVDPRVRFAAADAIAHYLTQSRRSRRVLDSLFMAAGDSNRFVRMKIINTLVSFTYKEHKTSVLNFFNDALSKEEDPFIRQKISKEIEADKAK